MSDGDIGSAGGAETTPPTVAEEVTTAVVAAAAAAPETTEDLSAAIAPNSDNATPNGETAEATSVPEPTSSPAPAETSILAGTDTAEVMPEEQQNGDGAVESQLDTAVEEPSSTDGIALVNDPPPPVEAKDPDTTIANGVPSNDVVDGNKVETSTMDGPVDMDVATDGGETGQELPKNGEGENGTTNTSDNSAPDPVTDPVDSVPSDTVEPSKTDDVDDDDKPTESPATTPNSKTEPAETTTNSPPPYLGRNASVGDTQPVLAERQVSMTEPQEQEAVPAPVDSTTPIDSTAVDSQADADGSAVTDGKTASVDISTTNGDESDPGVEKPDETMATENTIVPEVSSGSSKSETTPSSDTPVESATASTETKTEQPSELSKPSPPPAAAETEGPTETKDESEPVPMDIDESGAETVEKTEAADTVSAAKLEPSSSGIGDNGASPAADSPTNNDETVPMDVDEEDKGETVEATKQPSETVGTDEPSPMETEATPSAGDGKVEAQPPPVDPSSMTGQQTTSEQPTDASTVAVAQPSTAAEEAPGRDPPPPAAVPVGAPIGQQAVDATGAAGVPPPRPPGPPPPMGGGMKELRVEDALVYLDDVKREFGDRPRIYNEFLAIMKNFKSQEVDTPGVIQRVSRLFRGYNNLILGFNKFLPEGYKITLSDLENMDAAYAREQEMLRQQELAMSTKQQHGGPVGGVGQPHDPTQQAAIAGVGAPPPQVVAVAAAQGTMGGPGNQQQPQLGPGKAVGTKQNQAAPKQTVASKKKASGGKAAAGTLSAPPAAPPQPVHQAVEFDHAISYVTTIKRRFANDQNTYHSFLEILHTYQKEQRGIKEVLEQVAHLFQDHPDLLKEFTFFLPDAVQEQAKERLHRAAADSEARIAAKRAARLAATDTDKQKRADAPHPQPTGQPISDVLQGRKRKDMDAGPGPTPIAFPQHPEQYIYNSAVERQFFDAAKEALATFTRDGGQAWSEFLKCLDMYAQEILSRSEMLTFVEPLLGRRNNKLFEEFKRILQFAGGQGASFAPSFIEDAWYSVPLSEIDFSRCRKCSPSYRKLPRDYPAPPCSQRSDEEAKVLNDEWVSLPVGSEESYTFRHMRRNTYEETLFRIEDERFEIDMTIDSNLCTLALLEPFAEEMGQLSHAEIQGEDDREASVVSKGLGGKLFRYTFDKNILGVIHRNSITRIYGDSGKEMLDLMEKNPTVAIPIVVQRLQQKDIEWRKVRDRLNRDWKELAGHNYYKSLDHRSLTWRTTDKRALSTRALISEIKDRAANNGFESPSALQARIDKAKEEHGSFYETTMASAFTRKLDLSGLPKPGRLFTPHMAIAYDSNSHVQQDAYRILSFALERGSTAPADKERCHRLWTEFLGPWFGLHLNWMLLPAVSFQEDSLSPTASGVNRPTRSNQDGTDDDDSMDEDRDNGTEVVTMTEDTDKSTSSPSQIDHHPLPAGSVVSTVYGEGQIVECRQEDDMYIVKLAFGTAFLRPSHVLCSVVAAEKSAYTTQQMADDRTKLDRDDDMLAIGTQNLYLFFRLHQILCHRLRVARTLAYTVDNNASLKTLVEQIPGDPTGLGRRRYDAFMGLLFALLDGGTGTTAAEGGKFEDRVRSLLGHGGYELATLDKLIGHIVKNIQSMANDDTMWSLVQLFRRHLDAGGFKPDAFRQEASFLSDGEPMYAFQSCPIRKDGGDKSMLYMEYLGVISGPGEDEGSLSDKASGSDAPPPPPKRQKRGS